MQRKDVQFMKFKNTNPAPVTPPPASPGKNDVNEYFESIRNYSLAAINITEYPPYQNESVSTYRQRLVKICQMSQNT